MPLIRKAAAKRGAQGVRNLLFACGVLSSKGSDS
jgi:hypothetical protein